MGKISRRPASMSTVSTSLEKVEYAETIEVTAVLTPRLLGQLRQWIFPPMPEHKEDWEE